MSAPLHGVKAGGPLAGVPPRQAGSLMPRMVNGSSSTLGAPATGSAGTALTTTGPGAVAGEPSRSERRAHALHKYKQKRKVCLVLLSALYCALQGGRGFVARKASSIHHPVPWLVGSQLNMTSDVRN